MAEPREPAGGEGGAVSSAFLKRLAARTRMRRWSRTRTALVVAGVLTVVGVLGWVVLGSSFLTVETVQVRGVNGSLAAQIAAKADDQLGTPLARVDVDAVTRAVEEVPAAAEVRVSRSWPHTLSIDVVARRPAAAVRTDDGYRVVDPTGVTLGTYTRRPSGLPLVVLGTGRGADVRDGLTALRAAPAAVRDRVQKVDVRSAQDIRLDLDRGVMVRWGSAENSARKAVVLAALLGQRASVYDVSAPDLPTTRR